MNMLRPAKEIRRVTSRLRGTLLLGIRGSFSTRVTFLGRAPLLELRGTLTLAGALRTRSLQFRPLISVAPGAVLTLGDGVFLNQGAAIRSELAVTIGARVLLADLACVYDTDMHSVDGVSVVRRAPVVIEDDVWICRGALVLPGCRIGRASVVAAHAVVTGDVPSGVVVAGNPARIVREFAVPADFRRT